MNRRVDLSNIIIGDHSGSTQSPNENGDDTGVLTPSRESLLPPVSPYSNISTIQQEVEQYFGPGPSIATPRSMSLPSSSFSSLSPTTLSSILFPSPPSLPPIQRSPNSGLPPVIPSFPSAPLSNYDQPMLPVRRSPNFGLGRNFLEGLDTMDVGEKSQEESQGMVSHNEIAPSGNYLTRSVSADSFDSSTMFTEEEIKILKADKKLTELAKVDPKKAKRKLANRVSAARSAAKRLQYISELQAKIKTLESDITRRKTMYEQLQEYQIARDKEFSELKIVHEETEKHMQTLRHWNDQLNAQLSETTRELNQYRGEANMQQHRNPDFD